MEVNHRSRYHAAWSKLTPPLRPHPQSVAVMRELIGARAGPTLLLGVTPELADISDDLVAIDRNFSMVQHVWPGNTASRRAVVGDWRNCNFRPGSFSCCVGDASLGALRFPDELVAGCEEIGRGLRSGGRLICRVFVAPQLRESVEAVRAAAVSGTIGSFHAFKIRLAMALIADPARPGIGVNAILEAFNSLFRDRDGLARTTGWPRDQIDTVDFYHGSNVVFHFPERHALLAAVSRAFADPRLVPSGSYELADRAPVLIALAPG
jgi:SAM-dependent methyltransferase